jgi:hypothetical protein
MEKLPINDLTYDFVAGRLDYNADSGKLYWKPKGPDSGEYFWRRWNARYAGHEAGSPLNVRVGRPGSEKTRKTYRRVHLGDRDYLSHRIAWLLHYGEWPTGDVDHINGDSSDNRICNLRTATKSENHGNRVLISRVNTSGYRGVSLHKSGRWYAQLSKNGKHVLFKTFDNIEEAARAYDAAALEHFGEFAKLNFPPEVKQ